MIREPLFLDTLEAVLKSFFLPILARIEKPFISFCFVEASFSKRIISPGLVIYWFLGNMSERKQRINFQSGPRISKSLFFVEKNKQTNKQKIKRTDVLSRNIWSNWFSLWFFCLFARSSLNARVFQLSTNDEKSDLFCSESFSIEITETQNYGFLTLASAIYVH